MDLDAAIATATQEVANEQKALTEATAAEQTPQQEQQVEETPAQETEEDISKKPDDALTPEQLAKREKNRESHLNSKLADMRRQNRELQARLAQQQAPKPQEAAQDSATRPKPNPQDPFYKDKTWEQFNEDLTDWKLEQKFTENTKKTQETQQSQEFTKWVDERSAMVDERLPELSATIPDMMSVLDEVQDLTSMLTPEQARIALEAEDINLAVYTLHKEGKLQDAMRLPPSQLAAAIAKAEIRGQKYLTESKPTTNAPRPISASKGNTTGGKSLERQSVDELMSGLGFR